MAQDLSGQPLYVKVMANPTKFAFMLVVLSLFFPWFTVSTSENAEYADYYEKSHSKEYYGPDKYLVVTEDKWNLDNSRDSTISKFFIPVDLDVIQTDTDGEIFESFPIYLSLVLLKGKLLFAIALIAAAVLNSSYGKDVEITKFLLFLSTILMILIVIGFLISVRGDYEASFYGKILASTNDDTDGDGDSTDEDGKPDERIEMTAPLGYATIEDEDGAYIEGNYVDERTTVRWHPSIGFILAACSIWFLIDASRRFI